MALIAPNGNYIRIANIEPMSGNIQTERWESKDHRLAGMTEFYRPVSENYTIPPTLILDGPVDATNTLRNNIIKAGYLAVKQTDQFLNFTDDL